MATNGPTNPDLQFWRIPFSVGNILRLLSIAGVLHLLPVTRVRTCSGCRDTWAQLSCQCHVHTCVGERRRRVTEVWVLRRYRLSAWRCVVLCVVLWGVFSSVSRVGKCVPLTSILKLRVCKSFPVILCYVRTKCDYVYTLTLATYQHYVMISYGGNNSFLQLSQFYVNYICPQAILCW